MSDDGPISGVVWGLLAMLLAPVVVLLMAGAILSSPALCALIGSIIAAVVIGGVVRYVNHRDDPGMRPPSDVP